MGIEVDFMRLAEQARVKGEGMTAHIQWLKWNLPPAVFASISWMQPHLSPAKRSKRAIEIGWWNGAHPTVVVKRRGFRCDATLALICLMAP